MTHTITPAETITDRIVSARGYRISLVGGTQMYSALLAEDDGIYMATCDLRRPAYLLRLLPNTSVIERLGNMQDVTGEHDPEQIPQSKIHTQLVKDNQGRIWFGTHNEEMYNAVFGSMEIYPKGYPGGHLVNYDPKTRAFTDYGIHFPQTVAAPRSYRECGRYHLSMAGDPQRNILYSLMGDQIQIAAFDMTDGTLLDCQPLPLPYPYADDLEPRGPGFQQCRALAVAADGNAYSFTHAGQLFRYSLERKQIDMLDAWVPGGNKSFLNMPFAMTSNPERTLFYGNSYLSGNLFELCIECGHEPVIRDLGIPHQRWPGERTIHGIVMGLDGVVYFIGVGGWNGAGATCYSYDPTSETMAFHGTIVFDNLNGAVPYKAWAAAVATDGTLWFGGDVYPAYGDTFTPALSYFAIQPPSV